MQKSDIEQKIIEQIELLSNQKVPDNNYDIFTKGFLDSLNILHIILFIETEFQIQVNPYELSLDMLNSINKITNFIQTKLND